MKLVKACQSDVAGILKLHNELFDYEYTYDNYANELALDLADFMVLKNENSIVGYFIIHRIFEQLEIVMIGVALTYQNKGYGQFLFDYIIFLAKKYECSEIIIEVALTNQKALTFYEKNDFSMISQRNDYYGKNKHALIYRKLV